MAYSCNSSVRLPSAVSWSLHVNFKEQSNILTTKMHYLECNKIQNHKTRFMLSANSHMFQHQEVIFSESNNKKAS